MLELKIKNNENIKFLPGFTIVELITIIVVIGILASISVVSYGNWHHSVAVAQVKSDLNGVASAMQDARTFNNAFPTDLPSNFNKSADVTLKYFDGNDTSYCIEGVSVRDSSARFYISSTTGETPTVKEGVCGPLNLVATPVSGVQINLSWTTFTGATGYIWERASNSSFTSSLVTTEAGNITNTSSTGLTPSTRYYFRVKAKISGGESGWSMATSATTTSNVSVPTGQTVGLGIVGSTLTATASATCSSGTPQYGFKYQVNDGGFTTYTSWNATSTSSQSAVDGNKYDYKAQVRCKNGSEYSAAVETVESTITKEITTPSSPTVAANTVGSTTTWSWPAVTCTNGIANYQYRYTVSPSGYDSGWINLNQDRTVSFTTSTEAQTYLVEVQAKCSTAYATSAWSGSGSASYYRQITWKQISTGYKYTCGIKTVGDKAYCWGENGNGQLGINSTTDQSVPTAVYTAGALSGLTIKAIYAGYTHTCAIASNDAAYCWGLNNYGQIGDNSATQRTAPVLVSGGLTWSALAVSHSYSARHHTCGIRSGTSTVYCWGGNNYGQLGTNNTTQYQVPTVVYASGNLSGKTILKVAVGGDHSCVVASDNYAYCWGYNSNGQVGDNTTTQKTVPTVVNKTSGTSSLYNKVVSDISAGAYHTCAYASDGKAHCWGLNDSGQLGINSLTQKLVPNAVVTTGSLNGKTINSIQSGDSTNCVTAADNTAHCWGYNYFTQLGLGDSYFDDYYRVPMLVDQTSDENSSISDKTISKFGNTLGSTQSCLLTTEGIAYCSGSNDSGESGDGRGLGQYTASYWTVDDPL